jgi:hypothetical protein
MTKTPLHANFFFPSKKIKEAPNPNVRILCPKRQISICIVTQKT